MKYYQLTALTKDKELIYKEVLASSEYDAEVQAQSWLETLPNAVPDSWEVDEI